MKLIEIYLIEKDTKLWQYLTRSHLLIIPLTRRSVLLVKSFKLLYHLPPQHHSPMEIKTSPSDRASQNAVLHICSISPSVIIWKHIFEMMIIILNFNQILNLDYYDILCSSDKGKIFPLSELQKIPQVKTQAVNLYLFIYHFYLFIYIVGTYLFVYYWLIYTPMNTC